MTYLLDIYCNKKTENDVFFTIRFLFFSIK